MKGALGNHLKVPPLRLVHSWSITPYLRRISQESIKLKRSLTWIVPRVRSVRGENLEG